MNLPKELLETAELLRTQDNRMTRDPMFCVEVRERISGMDANYRDNKCWWNPGKMETRYDTEPTDMKGWEGPFGYIDRWKTVAVCFTEKGCKQHLQLNGHNYRHYEETRIFVECFNRNPEMIAIRDFLMSQHETTQDNKTS